MFCLLPPPLFSCRQVISRTSNSGFCFQVKKEVKQEPSLVQKQAKEFLSITNSSSLCCYMCVCSVAQLCQILCYLIDCSPPGPSVHRIPQARKLEWVAIPFSRGSCQPRDWTWVSCAAGKFFTIWTIKEAPLVYVKVEMLVISGVQLFAIPWTVAH